jgi:environmental stress-induced protein Ves
MSWVLVHAAQVAAQAWRNGGGVTRELLTWPSGSEWTVRISLADVEQNGPFSAFPGIARWFAVLSGAGVRLTVDGVDHVLDAGAAPLPFDGGATAHCVLLGGPTRDLNLMVRGRAGRMERISGSSSADVSAGTLVAAFANSNVATLTCGTDATELPAGSLAWRILTNDTRVVVTAEDTLWMEVEI